MTDQKSETAIDHLKHAHAATQLAIEKIKEYISAPWARPEHITYLSEIESRLARTMYDLKEMGDAGYTNDTQLTRLLWKVIDPLIFTITKNKTPEHAGGKDVDDMTDDELIRHNMDKATMANIRLRAVLKTIRDHLDEAILANHSNKPNRQLWRR